MDTSVSSRNVTVIGAGIVGTVCALGLVKQGHRVTLIDANEPGSGTSQGNAGSLSPGSIVPLAIPGTVRAIPGWLADPLGPLSISIGQMPRLLPWLVRFWRAGRADRVVPVVRAMQSLNRHCVDEFEALLDDAGTPELLAREGMLHVYRSERNFLGSAFARKLRTDHGVEVQEFDADAIHASVPALSRGYRRGFFLPDGGHVRNPRRVVLSAAGRFAALGGKQIRVAVEGFVRRQGTVVGLATSEGPIDVQDVVMAAGLGSRRLSAQLGIRVPVVAERGYHIEVAEPNVRLAHPVTDAEAKFVATPMEDGLRIAGTSEFTGPHTPPNWARAVVLENNARAMLPQIQLQQPRRWAGARPTTPDSLPVICRAPRDPNIFLAFGHGHWGLMAAPATAALITDLVARRTPRTDIAAFDVTRF